MQFNRHHSRGFVPTMGALHLGHLSLIEASKRDNEQTVVSIFVNPTQFAPHEDLAKYPRPFELDCEQAQAAGADIIFAPSVEEMYPVNPSLIHVPKVSALFEGEKRPGHFDGVATVVAKLFNIVNPQRAYFGKKDLQQCAVIRKLISDLNFDIELNLMPTLREADGLAMSSRNQYLNDAERLIAPLIFRELSALALKLKTSQLAPKDVDICLLQSEKVLTENGLKVEYLSLVDAKLMEPTKVIDDNCHLIIAARLGTTRLIDNLRVLDST